MRQEDIATAMIEQVKPKVRRPPGTTEKGVRLVVRRPVSIRGRKGLAYDVIFEGRGGANGEPLFVVSDDPNLAPLAAAMRKQLDTGFKMMNGIFGNDSPFNGMAGILDKGRRLSS